MRIVSWNVNGYRAAWRKGFEEKLPSLRADVLCLQETKAWAEQLTEAQRNPPGYVGHFSQPERKGYSGVATFCRQEPDAVRTGWGDGFDREGRVLITEHLDGALLLANIYFPNGTSGPERLAYKMAFYERALEVFTDLKRQGRHIVVVGDVNTAHKPLDLARPKENESTSGFLPEERAWLDRWVAAGFVDSFRLFEEEGGHYSWWDLRTRARERDVGWRIDYGFVSEEIADAVARAWIAPEVMGSDHCPVGLEINPEKV